MRLHAGVEYIENGMVNSIRAMQVQTHLIGISNENNQRLNYLLWNYWNRP